MEVENRAWSLGGPERSWMGLIALPRANCGANSSFSIEAIEATVGVIGDELMGPS